MYRAQNKPDNCGPVAIYNLVKYLGGHVPLNRLQDLCSWRDNRLRRGTMLRDLKRCLRLLEVPFVDKTRGSVPKAPCLLINKTKSGSWHVFFYDGKHSYNAVPKTKVRGIPKRLHIVGCLTLGIE